VGGVARVAMDDSFVYRKSGLGAAQLVQGRELSIRERQVLILIDGRRTIAELSELFGAETVRRLVPSLVARGFAKQVDTSRLDAWENAITQIHVASLGADRSRRASISRADAFALGWIVLLSAMAIGAGQWQVDRYKRQLDASWWGQTSAPARPTDASAVLASTGVVDARGRDGAPVVTNADLSRLRSAAERTVAAPKAEHAALQVVAPKRAAIARIPPRSALPARPTASPAAKRPAADPIAASATKVASPTAHEPSTQVASAADLSIAAAAAPVALPLAAPGLVPPAPVLAGAPETDAAVPAKAEAPPSDPASVASLQREPPRFPDQARIDGVGESQVRAHLRVTPEGKVEQVDIVQTTAPGVFDDEVRRALSLWTFEPTGQPTEQVVDLTLKP
jgi:TonB family protein